MPTPPLSDAKALEALRALQEHGTATAAAAALSLPRSTFNTRVAAAKQRGLDVKERIEAVGYDLNRDERTPEDAWNAGADEFERTLSDMFKKQWRTIKRPKGPVVIFHQTDIHADAPGCPLKLVEQDVRDAHDLGAIMCHGGDLLNNWPLAGRLAQQWAHQECTLPDALLRARYYIELMQPDVWTDGNHEEMNPYLVDLFKQWLPKKTITDYWSVNFRVETTGGRPIRAVMSHKFQKGSSWFHKVHGHIREMLEGDEADLLMDGHVHCDGVMDHSLPERGHSALAVASGGYKLVDKYARRISRGSLPKLRGRCHWIVYDTQAEKDETFGQAFKSARQAGAYLNGLQNLRAV